MRFKLKVVRISFFAYFISLVVLLIPLPRAEAQAQTNERLPRVLVVTSTVEPQHGRAGDHWTDLFEYGIIANVCSTSNYVSTNRSNYDIIIFSGYSNPVDPEDMYRDMITDVDAGRKLIFLNYLPFMQTYSNGTTFKTYCRLSIVGMPQNYVTGKLDTSSVVSLVCNPGDDYLKEGPSPSLSYAYYFATLPETVIGWVKDEISGHYFAIFTDKGGWIGESSCTALHMGKVVAKLWWGNTNRGFGFSMNQMYGAPVFLWRVDADYSDDKAALDWLVNLTIRYNHKCNIGAWGQKINSDVIASYWREVSTNPLVKVGVHAYTHQKPISAQNITHEVIDTYELLQSYNIPSEKFFIGYGFSDWSWQQIKTLFDYNWTVIHSSRDRRYPNDNDRYDIDTVANFTIAPSLLGVTGRSDYDAYSKNYNFTEANIESYKRCQETHLPFILLTHDYSYTDRFYNDYGPIRNQIEAFFDWLKSRGVFSVWITEYYDFFHDTFMAMITKSKNTFTVTRPNAKANFVKIFVGNNQTHAVGESVLVQKILDGWMYVTLKPETTTTFTLKTGVNPIPYVFSSMSPIFSVVFNQRLNITLGGVINSTGRVIIFDPWSGNPRLVKFNNGTVVNLFRQNDGISNIDVKFAGDKVQVTFGRFIWADRNWDYTSFMYNSSSKTLMVSFNQTLDRIRISEGGVTSTHCQVGSMQTVWFKAEYECDLMRFDDTQGMLFLNGEPMTWSDANSRWECGATSNFPATQAFKVTSIQNLYLVDCAELGRPTFVAKGSVLSFNETDKIAKIMVEGEKLAISWADKIDLTAIANFIESETFKPASINDLVGEKSVTWDEIRISEIDVDTSVLGKVKVRVTMTYAYTETPVTNAVVTANSIRCIETETCTYTCQLDDWNPFQSIRIKADLPDFVETVKNVSISHTMNLRFLYSLLICGLVIIACGLAYHYCLGKKPNN